jgi:arylsulfatase A-like enzyme/Tfp pilus assembly protein PilF
MEPTLSWPPRAGRKQICLWLIGLLLACGARKEDGSSSEGGQGEILPDELSVLLVTLDTTRADRLEPYGADDATTPTLLRLAQEGALFERAFATTPVTLPSHASIFTGLDPPAHGVRNNGSHYLDESAVTLAEILKSEGFRTAAFVSAAVLDRRFGLAQGFDLYDDDLSSGGPKEPKAIAERSAAATTDAARRWLDHLAEGERFFLWVHFFDPHFPYAPPDVFHQRFPDRPYDGEIAFVDAELGRLLSHQRLGSLDRAAVVVIGDHGESLGEHGEPTHGMLAYDSSLRVPWIVRLPGAAGGVRTTEVVGQIDLLPTLLEILGIEPPTRIAGRSQASALRAASAPSRTTRSLYAETLVPFYTYGWAKLRVVRSGGWKLIAAPTPELYDLENDPDEKTDLHATAPSQLPGLQHELEKLSGPAETEEESMEGLDPEIERKLRSLGYLSSRGARGARSVRPNPKNLIDVHRIVQQAEYYLSRLELDTAEREYRSALERDPENLAAISGLARTLGEQGRSDEALTAGRQALELAPDDAALHVTLAALEASNGRPEAALETIDTALALDPRSLDARIARARYLARLGRREETVAILRSAMNEEAGYPRLEIRFAELVELPAGQLESAEKRLRPALEREPYLADGWRILGQTLEESGRLDEAEKIYRQGLVFQPRDALLHEQLGLLLTRTGRLGPAESHLEKALELAKRPAAGVYDGLASIANRRGNWARAEEMARRALEIEGDLASGWNNLAIALEEQAELEAASSAYDRALAADPSLWQARLNQGLLLRKRQRFAEAADAFLEVLAQRPGHAGAHYELGLLYAGPLQDLPEGRQHLLASLEADPDHPRTAQIRSLLRALADRAGPTFEREDE